jgi:arylsulfatase A-like enzyme
VARGLQKARAVVKRRRNTRDSGAALTNERMLQWIDGSTTTDEPFFAFVNYMECHEPYNPPAPYDRRFMPAEYSPWRVARVGNNQHVLTKPEKTRREDLEIIRALYDGELNYLDAQIGQLTASLQRRGLLDNTLLVITADHGDSLGEHDQIGHRQALFEQLVHVPLVVHWPARLSSPRRVTGQVPLIDLHTTLLTAAEVAPEARAASAGQDLFSAPAARPFVIAENTAPKSQSSVVARMVRTDRHKLIWKSDERHELYDLAADPAETVNLAQQQPETLQQLTRQLESWQQSLVGGTVVVEEAEFDEAVLARLRDLGYVD